MEAQTNGHAKNGHAKVPSNFDSTFPPALRLQILEQITKNSEARDFDANKALFDKHKINNIQLGNWRTALRTGRLHPDPEKHPRLTARLKAFQKEASKEANRAKTAKARAAKLSKQKTQQKAKPKARIDLKRRRKVEVIADTSIEQSVSAAASLLNDLVRNVKEVERENIILRDALTKIREVCTTLLDG